MSAQLSDELGRALAHQSGPYNLCLGEFGWQFEATLTSIEPSSVWFTKLSLSWPVGQPLNMEKLKNLAGSVADRLTYLLETLRPIESDAKHLVVQMRSDKPATDGRFRRYYELLVSNGLISLARYEFSDNSRQVIPANITREVLEKIHNDLFLATSEFAK